MATFSDSNDPDYEITITGTKGNNPFSISNFKNRIGSLARPNLFYASLTIGSTTLNSYMLSKGISIVDTFPFRCETAEFPGRSVATFDDATGSGPAIKLPYDMTYNDTNITIICSEDMREREFFETWLDFIIGKPNSVSAGLINFYEDYAQGNQLRIRQLNSSGYELFSYILHNVYPIALTPMTASWEDSNTYQRFGVTLSHRYHTFNVGSEAIEQRS